MLLFPTQVILLLDIASANSGEKKYWMFQASLQDSHQITFFFTQLSKTHAKIHIESISTWTEVNKP